MNGRLVLCLSQSEVVVLASKQKNGDGKQFKRTILLVDVCILAVSSGELSIKWTPLGLDREMCADGAPFNAELKEVHFSLRCNA